MGSNDAILAVLAASPNHRIEGRKRLQKILWLVKLAGLPVDAEFEISHYGPYSERVANTADLLSVIGKIDESEEPLGSFNMIQSVYTLPSQPLSGGRDAPALPGPYNGLVAFLSDFSTTELEVAATIGYFKQSGLSESAAIARTRSMKPNKTISPVLAKAKHILGEIIRTAG